MATLPISDGPAGPARGRSVAARLLALFPFALVALVSLVELALADRKYGLFTGGFGQSRAVDTSGEVALFLAGYLAAQALIGLAGWALALRLARRGPAWAALFLFALINGALFLALLVAQYQLHSYFSDAVGFALLKQLGGGSLVDAILFGLSEIGVALIALVAVIAAAWIAWKLLARLLPADLPRSARPRRALSIGVIAAFFVSAIAIPRTGSDAAFGLNRTLAWQGLTGTLDALSDVDRDGYGLFGIQHDSAPFDGSRHPLALDVPGNGVDEDGYGGDLALVPLAAPLGSQVFTSERSHVVIVVMESTRGDVLGKRVNGKLVAPNLEALAVEGGAVPAYSHVAFTTESLKSLFSGQLAPRKGGPSLFRDLKASGYRIGVFSGQPEDFGGISETVGMRGAADVYVDAETLRDKRAFDFAAQGSLLVDESHLLDAFDRTLGAEDWQARPHFAYFNFQSAHFPYHHDGVRMRVADRPIERGAIGADRAAEVQATYWNAVANADAWLGELIARLKAKGVWNDTLLIVTGDHGEDLFEDGFLGHGHIVNQRQFGTVLVANRPGILPAGPLALADYRAVITAALRGEPPAPPAAPPFLHIGPLDAPTAIGLAGRGTLTSLRLDTGEACMTERSQCAPHGDFTGTDKARIDALIARWGSERWRAHRREGQAGH
ncbi:LTA synthase family protein [Pelagerythrobacter sp.]|uniref:LTA synthase family protein n=1 Tax=Pelagerythrobacter sp. TaxID=2800702 RepID=UPI0035B1537F